MSYSPLHEAPPPSYDDVIRIQEQHVVQHRHEPLQPELQVLVLHKDRAGRFGMGVASVDGSILVNFIQPSSPAELAGLKFGDEITSVDGESVAGYTADRACRMIKSSQSSVSLTVRDRPFTRTYLLEKAVNNTVGLHLIGNKVVKIERGSSAEQCGMEVKQRIVEVNGQSVVGCESKTVKLISKGPPSFFVAVLPKRVYKQMLPV